MLVLGGGAVSYERGDGRYTSEIHRDPEPGTRNPTPKTRDQTRNAQPDPETRHPEPESQIWALFIPVVEVAAYLHARGSPETRNLSCGSALEATRGQILNQSLTDGTSREVAFEWELTKETIYLPLGCLQGCWSYQLAAALRSTGHRRYLRWSHQERRCSILRPTQSRISPSEFRIQSSSV